MVSVWIIVGKWLRGMVCSMTDEYYVEDRREKELNEIDLVFGEFNRMNIARDTEVQRYCRGVETVIINLPRSIKYKAYDKLLELGLVRGQYDNITPEKLVRYDDLHNYIRDQLEKGKQMWVKKETKTFE